MDKLNLKKVLLNGRKVFNLINSMDGASKCGKMGHNLKECGLMASKLEKVCWKTQTEQFITGLLVTEWDIMAGNHLKMVLSIKENLKKIVSMDTVVWICQMERFILAILKTNFSMEEVFLNLKIKPAMMEIL